MELTDKPVKRLVIYFFFDKDGVVDRYVTYMLEEIKKNAAEVFIVCNGKLNPDGRAAFRKITPRVLVRSNEGFDVWAYKEAMEEYGWDELEAFDEIVMMNSTIMGPVYPLAEMFSEMDGRDLDFWGITQYNKVDFDPFGTISYGHIPAHIQSHFIAVRRSMVSSKEFQQYWESRPEITRYEEAVGMHEAIFTKYFEDKGFRYELFCDPEDLVGHTDHPIIKEPVLMLRKYRCPIFKRRSFFHEYDNLLGSSSGAEGQELMTYLRDETDYDTGMIWENILRTCNMADIKNCLHLSYVLPRDVEIAPSPKKKKTALVMHLYYPDLFESCYEYALSMPEDSGVILTTTTDEKVRKLKAVFAKGPWKKVVVLNIGNRGRDVSALLVGAAPYLKDYEYVCFMHDKKVPQLDNAIKGRAFSERCYQNMLGSRTLVRNIIGLFEKEPYMGILMPPPPNHADYYPTLGVEWGPNFDSTRALADKMKLRVPMSPDKEPVAPLGTMFWFRTASFKKLIDMEWKYEDFPQEPNKTDGTLLHAVERIYPFVAQDAGYYSAWMLSDDYARTEWTNLSYMLRQLNVQSFRLFGYNSHFGLVSSVRYQADLRESGMVAPGSAVQPYVPSLRRMIKDRLRTRVPRFIWNPVKKIYRFFGGKKWLDSEV